MFAIGDRVRFRNRCQPLPYMTVEAIDIAPLFGSVLYRLSGICGWWTEGNLIGVKE